MQSRDLIIRAYLGDNDAKESLSDHGESIYALLENDVLQLDAGRDEAVIKYLVVELMRKALHNVELLIERLESAGYVFAISEYLRIPPPDDATAQVERKFQNPRITEQSGKRFAYRVSERRTLTC